MKPSEARTDLRWQRILGRCFWLLGGASLALFIGLAASYWHGRSAVTTQARRLSERIAGPASGHIEHRLAAITNAVGLLIRDLTARQPDPETMRELLTQTGRLNPDIFEIGVAYLPYAYNSQYRLYGEALRQEGPGFRRLELDAQIDYTRPEVSWYQSALTNGPGWIEPSLDERGRTLTATYTAPFFRPDAPPGPPAPRGVVYISMSFTGIDSLLKSLPLGDSGYGFLASSRGFILSHPNVDYVTSRGQLSESPPFKQVPRLLSLAAQAAAGRGGQAPFVDSATGTATLLTCSPVGGSGWVLGMVYVPDDLASIGTPAPRHRQLIWIGLAGFASLVGLSAAMLRIQEARKWSLWTFSVLYSLLCLLATGAIVWVICRFPPAEPQPQMPVTNRSALRQFMREQNLKGIRSLRELPLYVPTGLYVQSATFLSANDVRLTGYVWQKYRDGVHDGTSRGFIMPESESTEIKEAYSKKEGDTLLLGWNFKAVLHQDFDFAHYPFGRQNIRVRLWHKDFYRNTILAPDFDSYKLTIPRALPGVLDEIVLPAWAIEQSYFSYNRHTYKSNFGFRDSAGLVNFPELYFNISIHKHILDAFVSHLLPIGVVFVLLFIILMLSDPREDKFKLLGFDTMKVAASCSGFFLVVVFSQIHLRESLSAKGLIYLEYFYFLNYAAILGVVLNALLYALSNNRLVHYGENLLPKILFWPLILTSLLVVTSLSYY